VLRESATLAAAGVTLLGVMVNIALTIGFGLSAPLLWRVVAAIGATLALAAVIAVGSRRSDLLVRLAVWLTRYEPQ
jgi:hypothetical protein